MNFSDSVLVESKSARDQGLVELGQKSSEKDILIAVKQLFFAMWRGQEYMTAEQVSDFYEVSVDTIGKNRNRHAVEFHADGVLYVDGDELRELKQLPDMMSGSSSNARHAYLYPLRAVLRMGFILTESPVASAVRTASLNIIQGAIVLAAPDVLESLITAYPVLSSVANNGKLSVSAPIASFYSAIRPKLKKHYPEGVLSGLSKEGIRKSLASLSTHTANLKFETQKELSFPSSLSDRSKYPDLTSGKLKLMIDGKEAEVVFLIQIQQLTTDIKHVEDAIGKQYIKIAKESLGVDHAFLFFVSPLGATPDAKDYIENRLPQEIKNFVGAMTVKEVAVALQDQAFRERGHNIIKGQIAREFNHLTEYEIPESQYFPGEHQQGSLLDLLP
jgi:hypothetical protein